MIRVGLKTTWNPYSFLQETHSFLDSLLFGYFLLGHFWTMNWKPSLNFKFRMLGFHVFWFFMGCSMILVLSNCWDSNSCVGALCALGFHDGNDFDTKSLPDSMFSCDWWGGNGSDQPRRDHMFRTSAWSGMPSKPISSLSMNSSIV